MFWGVRFMTNMIMTPAIHTQRTAVRPLTIRYIIEWMLKWKRRTSSTPPSTLITRRTAVTP